MTVTVPVRLRVCTETTSKIAKDQEKPAEALYDALTHQGGETYGKQLVDAQFDVPADELEVAKEMGLVEVQ